MFNFLVGIIHSRCFLLLLSFGSIEVGMRFLFSDAYIGLGQLFWFVNTFVYFCDGVLFLYIILSFFWVLKRGDRLSTLTYILRLMVGFVLYLFANFKVYMLGVVSQSNVDSAGVFIYELDFGLLFARALLVFFAIVFLMLLYWEFINKNFFIVELPLLVAILLWFFCIGLLSFNFLFLFLLMESITLLIVIILAIYFIFFGARLIRPVIQFFVFNLIVSTFYLLGLGLLFFFIPVSSFENLSYLTFLINFWVGCLSGYLEPTLLIFIFKLIIWFLLIPFVFKITLAPFSFWVVQIYSRLPFIFLVVLMSVYKFVYILLFLKLFVYVIGSISIFQLSLSKSLVFIIIPSMFIGCFAYRAADLKTVLALTTVSQLGYIMSAVIVQDSSALKYGMIYILFYMLNLIAVFIIFIILQKQFFIVNFNQLYLVKYYNKYWFYMLFILFASLAGFPPFAGFYLKYFLFIHIYKAGWFGMSVAGILSGYIMSIIYLQLLIELAMPRYFTENQHQFKSLGTLLLVSASFLERRVIQYYINWIFVGLLMFSGFLCLFNLFFFAVVEFFAIFCGLLVYYFIYNIPVLFADGYAPELDHLHWFSNSFQIPELKWTSDRSVENVSENLQVLWKAATLSSINLDVLLNWSVIYSDGSFDFSINGQKFELPRNWDRTELVRPWEGRMHSRIGEKSSSTIFTPVEYMWAVDKVLVDIREPIMAFKALWLPLFSCQDYVNIVDVVSSSSIIEQIHLMPSDSDYSKWYNASHTFLIVVDPALENSLPGLGTRYRGYFEFLLNYEEGYYPIDPALWPDSLSFSRAMRNRTRQIEGCVGFQDIIRSWQTDGYWLGANVPAPGPYNSVYDTIQSDRNVLNAIDEFELRISGNK